MKYIWMIMLGIIYLIWGVCSVKDFLYCRKTFTDPLDNCEGYTIIFIFLNIGLLFILSLGMWLKSKMG